MDLDPKDEEDRALLQAIPVIAGALLPHIARDPAQICVLFSTRRREPPVRVLSSPFGPLDDETTKLLAGAPLMPWVRVVSLRKDGTTVCRDVRVSDLTEREETAPS
jgi:hypothetical protein